VIRKCDNHGGRCVDFDDSKEGEYLEHHTWCEEEDGSMTPVIESVWFCPVCAQEDEYVADIFNWAWDCNELRPPQRVATL